jgi:HNH endonuclease
VKTCDIALLKRLFDYNPETGSLIWRERTSEDCANPHELKRWNSRYAGKLARHVPKSGYHIVAIFRRSYMAHSIAWALSYGEWPVGVIDHINGNCGDNRLCNLRAVSIAENMRNKARYRNNPSGVTGVFWNAHRNKWVARIRMNGIDKHIGVFVNFSDAVEARKSAEVTLGFHFNHGRAPDEQDKPAVRPM